MPYILNPPKRGKRAGSDVDDPSGVLGQGLGTELLHVAGEDREADTVADERIADGPIQRLGLRVGLGAQMVGRYVRAPCPRQDLGVPVIADDDRGPGLETPGLAGILDGRFASLTTFRSMILFRSPKRPFEIPIPAESGSIILSARSMRPSGRVALIEGANERGSDVILVRVGKMLRAELDSFSFVVTVIDFNDAATGLIDDDAVWSAIVLIEIAGDADE